MEAAGEGGGEVGGRPGDHGAEGRVAEGHGRHQPLHGRHGDAVAAVEKWVLIYRPDPRKRKPAVITEVLCLNIE